MIGGKKKINTKESKKEKEKKNKLRKQMNK